MKPNFLDMIEQIVRGIVPELFRVWVDVDRGGVIRVTTLGPERHSRSCLVIDRKRAKHLYRHASTEDFKEYIETQFAIARLTDGL